MKKTKKQWTSTLGPAILEVMRQAGRPLLLREILKALNATGQKTAKPDLLNAMEGLVKAGKVVELKGNRYGLTDMLRLVTGRLSVHPDGFGFVTPDDAVAKSRTCLLYTSPSPRD